LTVAASGKPSFTEVLRTGWAPPAKRGRGSRPQAGQRRTGKGARQAAVSPNGAAPGIGESELIKQREQLAHQFAELQWDLGGMAYEMAARDHYRLDVLNKQAARLQEVDAQLGQLERVMKMEEAGAAGTCPSCGAVQARGAVFCWQCGKELKPPAKPAAESKKTDSE
jgi:hypothetical protein